MANVYYKFNSELNFSHVGFDGLHISVGDLKKAILHQKRLGKTADFDLLISNAQTKEEYVEENCLIPKNTSLIVARVPLITNQYNKRWEQPAPTHNNAVASEPNMASADNVDLSKMNGSEEDKIQAMMLQSTLDYDPSSYQRVRGSTQMGEVPSSYRCHRCHKTGHWIKNCPLNPPIKDHYHKVRPESKKMTGIPRSLRDNPPPNKVEPTENQKVVEEKKEPPEDLLCSICKGIFRDAVMIPCCGSSFCDECIRTALLESDDNECPECNEKGTSPGSLIPNRFLRTNVAAFSTDSNTTGNGRDKHAVESHDETPTRPIEASPQIDDLKDVENDSQKLESPPQKPAEVESKHENEKEQSHSEEEEEDDDDDNITVTVPPASHQCGPVSIFRDTSMVRISHRAKEIHERHNLVEETPQGGNEVSHQKAPSQYSDSSYYYNNEPYKNEQQPQQHSSQNSSYPPDEPENNYMAGPPSSGPQNSLYPPHNMYNQQGPTSQMQMRPQFGQYQGQPHQPPFYQQQNVRPYRYDHHNNYQQPMRHHHHHGPHQQYPMHPGHGNYGMRYQRNEHNLANAVEHNIKQRFGSGVIEDPLEAFNKIMREKEMRKDRRRSPARFNEGRARSPVRKYSPDRYKSPQRRRKRTRSFSSNSSRSRSRSRSGDRHHERDYRKKHRVTDRNKPSETRSKHRNKSFDHSPDPRKVNHDNSSNTSALQEIKPTTEDLQNMQNPQDELISNQPPPPGDEENISETKIGIDTNDHSRGDDEMRSGDENLKAPKEKSTEKSLSSEDNKRSKKIRDKKKHKKSDTKGKKKKKRDRKEKRSVSRSVTEDESILAKHVEATDDEKSIAKDPKDDIETSPATTSAFDKTATSSEHEVDEFKPELSKWEKDESQIEKHEDEEIETKVKFSKDNRSDDGKATVTTEILKRAENVLFSKSSTSRVSKDQSSDRSKDTSPLPSIIKKVDHEKKIDTYQITVPVESGMRSVEIKPAHGSKSSKNEPIRSSIKERLGKKVNERSRTRSRTPERKHHSVNNNKSSTSKQDNRKNLSSTISSVKSSTRSREPARRRSRSYDRRDHNIKKYQRSKSRSLSRARNKDERGNQRTDRHHRSKEREPPRQSKPEPKPLRKDQKTKRRSDSPRSDDGNERKKLRSSSVESKKQKKKKKKEKKAKKKSRETK